MSSESPADEVLIIEEEVTDEPNVVATPRRPVWLRVAGFAIGGIGLSVIAATTVRWLASGRRNRRVRRRGAIIDARPRIGVFAPSLTISLPFSGIVTQTPPRRVRANRQRATQMRGRTARRTVRGARRTAPAARGWRFARPSPAR